MPTLNFIISLISAALLLLYGVYLVRTGIERFWGPGLRDWISVPRSKLSLLAVGASTALIMQGGTAVVLMVAGLAGSGVFPIVSAATVALGAELGSALVLIFLSFPITGLSPILILFGGILFLWGQARNSRALGRIFLGLGLLFLAITQIKSVAAPFQDLSALTQISTYLNSDIVAAALLGMILTMIMHSSVAALVTASAFVVSDVFQAPFAIGFVLGANVGSALIPMWLLRSNGRSGQAGWQIALTIGKMRIGLAATVLLGLLFVPSLAELTSGITSVQAIVAAHLTFNAVMLFGAFAIPSLLGDSQLSATGVEQTVFAPDQEPDIQAISFKKDVLNMLDSLRELFEAVFSDPPDENATATISGRIRSSLDAIKSNYANIDITSDDDLADIDRQMDFATRIERSSGIVSGRLLDDRLRGVRFSEEGASEVDRLLAHVKATIVMAHEVLATGNTQSARMLVKRKQAGSVAEQESRENHYTRLKRGNQASISSSDEHLEAIASLKEVNSKLCTVAYSILEAEGALKKTRLRSLSKKDEVAS